MLILQGLLRAATTIGGGTNKKTGEVFPLRNVLQVEVVDGRGLVEVKTITVPDLGSYADKVGQKVNVPVRAWAQSATVNFMYENPVQQAA
jgi:hypothetical protein